MGSEVSGGEADACRLLADAMAEHEAKTGDSEVRSLLSRLSRELPDVDATDLYDPVKWAVAGVKLWVQATRGDPTASSLLPLWCDVLEVVSKHGGSTDPARLSIPLAPPAEPGSDDPAGPRPIHPGRASDLHPPDPRDAWRNIREKAEKEGDVELLLLLNAACPNLYEGSHGSQWERLSFTLIKELKEAVLDFGLTSPYAKKLLESILSSYLFYPYDCTVLAKLILTPMQYAVWSMFWQEAAEQIVLGYQRRSHGDPVRALGVDALLGQGQYIAVAAQARLPIAALNDSREAALRAFMRIAAEGEPRRSFSTVWQGPTEPYAQFIDKLKDALDKQIENEEVKEILLKSFAIKNANEDCREILQPLRNPTVVQMLEACSSVGTISHQSSVIASAVAALQISQQSCFSCGQPGHVKRNCPDRQRVQGPSVCPRCQKGPHPSSQCWSRFDKEGRPIPGTGSRSARRGRAMPQAAPAPRSAAGPLHLACSQEPAAAPQRVWRHR